MRLIPVQSGFFDDEATRVMGSAFDKACSWLPRFPGAERTRERVAKRIIEAVQNGERDPARLYSQALMGFFVGDVSVSDGVAREIPIPGCVLVARTA
jgi:hypothetical protein